jgi:predicted transcriptional regulator
MNQPNPTRRTTLLSAALAYAKRGLYVVPLHEPLFDDDGNLTGCSCEAHKRSAKYKTWLESKGHRTKFDPNYKCRTPGKHPRLSDWEALASNDPAQISKWWHQWPTANIGIAAGKSGTIAFDRDYYKEIYGDDSALFTQADKETATQISQNGGEHLVYQMPAGKHYSNANSTLPPGIDIRGFGGMFVVEPSIGPSGNQWMWEDGYSILECDPLPLPPALMAVLDEAHASHTTAKAVSFTTPTTERPELIRWKISKDMRDLIHNPPPRGGRSEADYSVCLSLAYAGATDDEILGVFEHYPIGVQGKYAEAGQRYLALTIGEARGYMEQYPRPDIGATVDNLLLWVRTHSFEPFMAEEFLTLWTNPNTGAQKLIYITDGTDTKVSDAILCEMKAKQRLTINIGKKRLGKLAGVGCNTALRALARLHGWLFDVTLDPLHGAQVALCEASRLHQMDPLLASAFVFKRDPSGANDSATPVINEYSPRKANEPFLIGTSRYMRERFMLIAQTLDITVTQAKVQDELTFPGLGEPSIRVIDALIRAGDMTAKELCEETGKKISSIRTACKRLAQHGILIAERACATEPYTYSLCADVWQRIDEIAPNLRNYKTKSRRESKRIESAQQWCMKGIDEAKEAQDTEQAQRLNRRFAHLAKERVSHLERLHPELSPDDIKRLAYEVAGYKRSPKTEQAVRTERTEARAEHREHVALIRDLADSYADVGTPLEEVFNKIMLFGCFDARMVRDVLQSKRQMAHYETLDEVRQRLDYAEKTTLPPLATVHPQPSQPALTGWN